MSLQYNPFSKSAKISRLSYKSGTTLKKSKPKTPVPDSDNSSLKRKKSKKTPRSTEENNPFLNIKEEVESDSEKTESEEEVEETEEKIKLEFKEDSTKESITDENAESIPESTTAADAGAAKEPEADASPVKESKPKKSQSSSNPFLQKEKKPRTPRPDDDEKPRKKREKSPVPKEKNPFVSSPTPAAKSTPTESVPKVNPFMNKESPTIVIEEPPVSQSQAIEERVHNFIQNCPMPPNTLIPSSTYTSLPIPPPEGADCNPYLIPKVLNYVLYLYQNRAYHTLLQLTTPIISLSIENIQDYSIYFSIYMYHLYSLLALDDIQSVLNLYNQTPLYSEVFVKRNPIYVQNVSIEFKVLLACLPAYNNDISASLQNLYSLYIALDNSNNESSAAKKIYSRGRSSSVLAIEQNRSEMKSLKQEQIAKYRFLIEKQILGLLVKQRKYPLIMQFIDDVLTSYLDNSNPSYINYFLDQALKVCIQNDDEKKMESLLDQFNDTFNDAETIEYYKVLLQMKKGQFYSSLSTLESLLSTLSNDSLRLSCANNYCICCLHCCQVDAAISKLEELILENPYLFVNRTLFKNLTYMYDLSLSPEESTIRKLAFKVIFKEYEIEYINDTDLKLTN